MRAKLSVLSAGLCLLAAQAQPITVLKTVAQDNSAPKFLQSPSGTTGFCVDAMRAIERVSRTLRFEGERRWEPTGRIENELAAGTLDVACGLARNSERERRAVYLEPALFQARYVLAVRADDPVEVSRLDDIRKLGADGTILGVHGLSVMNILSEEGGLIIDDASFTPEANLKKLLLGRGRFFFYRSPGMNAVIRAAGLEGKVRVLPAFTYTTRLYMLAAQTVPRETIELLERSIAELERRGELARIYAKWRELDR